MDPSQLSQLITLWDWLSFRIRDFESISLLKNFIHEFHILHFDHIQTFPFRSYLIMLPPNFIALLLFIFLLKVFESDVCSKYSWVWVYPLESCQLTGNPIRKENWLSLSQNPSSANRSSDGACPSPLSMLGPYLAWFCTSLVRAVEVSVAHMYSCLVVSRQQLPCIHLPLTPVVSLTLLFCHDPWALGREGVI